MLDWLYKLMVIFIVIWCVISCIIMAIIWVLWKSGELFTNWITSRPDWGMVVDVGTKYGDSFKNFYKGMTYIFDKYSVLMFILLILFCVISYFCFDVASAFIRSVTFSILLYIIYPSKIMIILAVVSGISSFIYAYYMDTFSQLASVLLYGFFFLHVFFHSFGWIITNKYGEDALTNVDRVWAPKDLIVILLFYLVLIAGCSIGLPCFFIFKKHKRYLFKDLIIKDDYIYKSNLIRFSKIAVIFNCISLLLIILILGFGLAKYISFFDSPLLITMFIIFVLFLILASAYFVVVNFKILLDISEKYNNRDTVNVLAEFGGLKRMTVKKNQYNNQNRF